MFNTVGPAANGVAFEICRPCSVGCVCDGNCDGFVLVCSLSMIFSFAFLDFFSDSTGCSSPRRRAPFLMLYVLSRLERFHPLPSLSVR